MDKIQQLLYKGKALVGGKLNGKAKYLVLLAFVLISIPGQAFGLTSQQQLNQINSQINTLNSQLNKKKQEKDSLQREVDVMTAQLRQTELEIQASNLEISILTNEITGTTNQIIETDKKLKIEQERMKEYLRVLYEEGNISFLEQLAKSNTFSDFMDRREYLTSTQLKLKEIADKIAKLKKELEEKKKQLEGKKKRAEELKKSQEARRAAQAAQKAYKDQLLAQLKAQQAGLQSQLNDLHARKAALSVTYGESVTRGTSSYPYGNPPARRIIDTPDPWGYLIGECTSYVAWKRTTIGRPVPRGLGNANTWGSRAASMGLSVNRTPRPGDVMVMPYLGGYGHVAYVEAVYSSGQVLISEYNWTPYSYSKRVVNPYNYSALFIH